MFKVKEGLKLFNNQTTVRYPTGTYGSFEIDGGAKNSYEGFSIGGRAVFMHDNGTAMGLYNDVNNQWALLSYFGGDTRLYHAGNEKISTKSDGVQVQGLLKFNSTVTTTSQNYGIEWTAFDKEGTTDYSDAAYIKHLTNTAGLGGSVLEISSMNDANDGINLKVNSSTAGARVNGNPIFHDAYHPNADKWTTARRHTVTLTGDVTGSAYQDVDGTGNKTWTISTSVANDSHTHDTRYKRVYKSTATINTSYTTVATINGDRLASAVEMSVQGTSGSVVINTVATIMVNHSQDILIKSESGIYTQIKIKVTSNNNEYYAIELARVGGSGDTTVAIEFTPKNSENITFASSHGYTGNSLEHQTEVGTKQLATGGSNYNFTSGGVISGDTYRINGTTVIDSARNAVGFVDIKGSGSYHEFGNAIGSVSNDGGWNARLNLAGSSHAKLDVKSVSDGIITSMYSHTGHAQGRIGTTSNHSLGLMVNGSVNATVDSNGLDALALGVTNSANNTGRGLSLYGGATSGMPTYGIAFAGTATFGNHGGVTSDWATYFTMSDSATRGWIFKRGSTNVASIDGGGDATFSGTLLAGGDIITTSRLRVDDETYGFTTSFYDTEAWRGQAIIDSRYSDLIIASRESNSNTHGSTLTFATQSTSTNDYAKIVLNQGQYNKGAHLLSFSYGLNQRNPHTTCGTNNVNAGVIMDLSGKTLNVINGYQLNGTTIIDSSRNLTNIGTGSFSGELRVNNEIVSQAHGQVMGVFKGHTNHNHMITLRGNVTGSTSSPVFDDGHQTCFVEFMNPRDDTVGWFFKDAYGNGSYNYTNVAQINTNGITAHQGGFRIGSTTVIDSSRNLTNIANATASGTVKGSVLESSYWVTKQLTGSGIGSSYKERVVLLCPKIETSTAHTNIVDGKITALKTGGNVCDTFDVFCHSVWNDTRATFTSRGQRGGHKLVEFNYDGIKWIGIKFSYTANPYNYFLFQGQAYTNVSGNNGHQLKVISYYDTRNGGSVLNSEIYNSLVDYNGYGIEHKTTANTHLFTDAIGTTDYAVFNSDGLDIRSGGLEINGTSVIDSNRNLLNLSGSLKSDNEFILLTSSSNAQTLQTGGIGIGSSYSSYPAYTGGVNVQNGYQVNGTTVIDSSRNLTNISKIEVSGKRSTHLQPFCYILDNHNASVDGTKNSSALSVRSEYGNHSWGITQEVRINATTGDSPSILFSKGGTANTFSIGYGYNDTGTFRIKRDHGYLNSDWGTALMSLDRSGNVTFAGNVTAYSDERLKTNIKTIENPIDIISKIRGVSFDWKETGEHAIGVIAQEIEAVPELSCLVSETPEDGTSEFRQKNVAYGNMVGLLIEAIKEQQTQIAKLQAQIKEIKGE